MPDGPGRSLRVCFLSVISTCTAERRSAPDTSDPPRTEVAIACVSEPLRASAKVKDGRVPVRVYLPGQDDVSREL